MAEVMRSPDTVVEALEPGVFKASHKVSTPHKPSLLHDDSENLSVAVRIRPLTGFEDDHEMLSVFGSTRGFDRQQHLISTKSSSESTTTTILGHSESTGRLSFDSSDPPNQAESSHTYKTVQVGQGGMAPMFTFDHVFPSSTRQEDIYNGCVTPLIDSCLEGYNATCMAYGQTGSGKTHTILGDIGNASVNHMQDDADQNFTLKKEMEGVIPRAMRSIVQGLKDRQEHASLQEDSKENLPATTKGQRPFEYSLKVQFVELYGEEIRDLLADPVLVDRTKRELRRYNSTSSFASAGNSVRSKDKITIRDGKAGEGAELLGIERIQIHSAEDALNLLRKGLTKRVVGRTAMNAHSSRSHAIFTVEVLQTTRSQTVSAGNERTNVEMKTSKIHFVDLCGSERAKRAQTAGKRLKEGIDINKGLLVLGNVISALGRGGSHTHVPYRDSKLTRILKGSLGGNHKTLMIACVSPSSLNASETVNTLRYANRAKNIKNRAKINVDPQSKVVNELRAQVSALASALLSMHKNSSSDAFPFSVDFLNNLVSGDKISSHNVGSSLKSSKSLDTDDGDREGDNNIRPSTSPETALPKRGRFTPQKVSWNLKKGKSMDDGSKLENPVNDAEDPELAKNIESYDFALATLRETIDQESLRQSLTENTPSELWVDPKETNNGGGFNDDGIQQSEGIPEPSSPPPALKKVRNIDELYEYLNNNTFVNERGDIVDEEGTVVSAVVSSHVAKLNDAISQNEQLLKEMTSCHEIFETMKTDNADKLSEIETELQLFRKEKHNLADVKKMYEDESKHSKGLLKALSVKDQKIAELLEEREELLKLSEKSNDNLKSITGLKDSINVMKRQRSDLSRIISRPRTPDDQASISQSSYDVRSAPGTMSPRTDSFRAQSGHPVMGTDSDSVSEPTVGESENRRSSANGGYELRSRFSSWETDDNNHQSVDSRLRDANVVAETNKPSNEGHLVDLGSSPPFLNTNLELSNHTSNVSLLETNVLGADRTSMKAKMPRHKRGSAVPLETHREVSKARPTALATTNPPVDAKKVRRPRGSRPPRRISFNESEIRDQKKVKNWSTKTDDQTASTVTTPRSVFEVIEESVSKSSTLSSHYEYGTHNAYHDPGGEEVVFCGASFIKDTLQDFFGLKNPVLKTWDA